MIRRSIFLSMGLAAVLFSYATAFAAVDARTRCTIAQRKAAIRFVNTLHRCVVKEQINPMFDGEKCYWSGVARLKSGFAKAIVQGGGFCTFYSDPLDSAPLSSALESAMNSYIPGEMGLFSYAGQEQLSCAKKKTKAAKNYYIGQIKCGNLDLIQSPKASNCWANVQARFEANLVKASALDCPVQGSSVIDIEGALIEYENLLFLYL